MRLYKYIYYKLYSFFRLINEDIPDFLATIALVWLFCFNSISLVVCLELPDDTIVFAGYNFEIGVVIILAAHYFFFSFNDRYELILEKFKDESKTSNVIGSILVLAYVILSIYLYFGYAIPNTKIVPQ